MAARRCAAAAAHSAPEAFAHCFPLHESVGFSTWTAVLSEKPRESYGGGERWGFHGRCAGW